VTGKETERIDALLDELRRARASEAALAERVRYLDGVIRLALLRHRDRSAPPVVIFEILADDLRAAR
jgi:hypothetical protein